ncbi:hypothetical protein [Owenweeksia hongkongensis]|uniref:hypothetical protein n=1 Tax=Owenweeksia hongkongensis TaxID=253245 RepID=UPI003A91DB53
MIATVFSVAIIGQSCSKEITENDSSESKSLRKSLPASESLVYAAVDGFSTEVYNYATGQPYAIDDLEVGYAVDLMEATFNYQHAVSSEDFDDQVTNGLFGIEKVEYTMNIESYTDAESGQVFIAGDVSPVVFMDMLADMQDSLAGGGDEYYFNSDFKYISTESGVSKVSIVALKALSSFPTGPVTTSHKIYKSGNCSGTFRQNAALRMAPTVFRNARTVNPPHGEVFYNYNVEDMTVGRVTYFGPRSNNPTYCGILVGKSTELGPNGGGYLSCQSETTDRCMSVQEINNNIDAHNLIIAAEIPVGKEFTGVYVGYRNGITGSGQPSYWHYTYATYGQFGGKDLNDFNQRTNNLIDIL